MKNSIVENELIDMDVCPSCWGWEEYQDTFKDKSKKLDHDRIYRKAFILEFVEKNITGVKLQNQGGKSVCPRCKKEYSKKI